jgi:hypothetical protein
MSNWNISAGSAPVNVNGVMSGVDNDQGTIRAGGNIASARFSADAVNLGLSRHITIVSGNAAIESPLAAGAFNAGDQVIRRVTNDLAGVSNTVLLSGGSNSANRPFSIKQKTTISTYYYKTAVRTGGWHEFSGVFDPAVSVGATGAWSQATDTDVSSELVTSGVDHAANPSAAIPGELVYRNGGPNPVQADYAAKTVY